MDSLTCQTMSSQNGKPCQKPQGYGKVKRSTPAYNIFDLDDASGGGTQGRSSSEKDGARRGQQQTHRQVSTSTEAAPKDTLGTFCQRLTSKQKQLSSDLSTQNECGSGNGADQYTSAFDLPLSDEEDSTMIFQKSMQKRRRLTPVKNQGSSARCHQKQSITNEDNIECSWDIRNIRPTTTSNSQTKTTLVSRTARRPPRRANISAPEDHTLSSQAPLRNAPKQTRLLSDLLQSAGATDSPSKLSLKSLSLTSEVNSCSEPIKPRSKSHSQVNQVQRRLQRPKKRLIDAMVSPRKSLSGSASSASSEGSGLGAFDSLCEMSDMKNEVRPVALPNANEKDRVKRAGENVQINSSNSLNGGKKIKATYSRERSHLADMLIDHPDQSDSQEGSFPVSQNSVILSSIGSSVSHNDSEEDLEQEVAGIRSIHELRHSGGNVRSQVDLETVLEDIEAEGPSARARRLRGLVQLTERLRDPQIRRHTLGQYLDQRLNRCSHLGGDVVGQTLLMMILSHLMISLQLPASSLKGVLEALVDSGKSLLQESTEFASIVRDRKQNLSKVICREVTALIEPFCSSAVWSDRYPKSPSPALICIRSLDIAMRQLRQLGDLSMVLPASIFGPLVQLLLQTAPTQLFDTIDKDSVLVVQSAVSVIESLTISKSWAEDGCLEIAKRLSGLGPILGFLSVSSAGSSDRSHHLILRLILNITNNDSDLCKAFSGPALLSAIFGIVKRDFLQAPTLAEAVLKESQLEGVILALGAMSNLAEHSGLFRQAMLKNSLDGRTMVDWIALAFRDQVEVASEVRPLPFTDC